jgi:hypothetical protein
VQIHRRKDDIRQQPLAIFYDGSGSFVTTGL